MKTSEINSILEDLEATPSIDELMETAEITVAAEIAEPTIVEPNLPSNHYSPGPSSAIEERALNLLGSGVAAESVASALGVTPSRIAQFLSVDAFADKVANLRYKALQEHNVRDGKYDALEDRLLIKLEKSLPLMVRPETILKAMSTVNGAKRRGQSAPEQVTNQQNIVNLVLPAKIAEQFSVAININNQVTKAGGQELLTMPSGNLLKQVEDAVIAREESGVKEISNAQDERAI